MNFWDYMSRVDEMAWRERPFHSAKNHRDGWFDVPGWVYREALRIADQKDTGVIHRKRLILCGHPIRVDVFMDNDALRYVTPAGGPHA